MSVVKQQLGLVIGRVGESDYHAMHMRFEARLAVPSEGAVGEVDVRAKHLLERFPYRRHLLALRDGVGGDEGGTDSGALHHLGSLVVPSRHIVYLAGGLEGFAFLVHEYAEQVCLLLLALQRIAHKRRIADDVVQLFLRAHALPLYPQRVALHDVGVALQGQEVDVVVDDLLRLRHHLRLADPEGGGGHGDGEVVDLDAIKLVDAHLDGILKGIELLHAVYLLDNLVLQAAQGEVGLREEVARAAGRVEEAEGGHPVLQLVQQLHALLHHRLLLTVF